MSGGTTVSFHGVRGSTPCEGPQYARYGGHSSCVSMELEGEPPIIFDMGTGLRPYGSSLTGDFHGAVLLSHLHWDHVQGLPFFTPVHCPGNSLDVYGPHQETGTLGEVFTRLMEPPFFPIRPAGLNGEVRFHDASEDDFPVGHAKVRSRSVRHVGPTLGFRVEWHGTSVAYIPDHGPGCCPDDADDYIPDGVLELCDGVDLLIHDAQHTPEEFEPKRHWGHSTLDYALHVAREARVGTLALFHHDPAHGDDELDELALGLTRRSGDAGGPVVIAAHEGLRVQLGAPAGHG